MKFLILFFISCFVAQLYAEQVGIVAYDLPDQRIWTQEEMDNAIPMPLLQVDGSPPFSVDELKMATCNANNTLLNTNYAGHYSRPAMRSTGKIFFTLKGANYVCSGSIGANNLVWTAGHCVCEPSATQFNNPTYATSVTYSPHYYNGQGTQLVGRSWYSSSQWANGRGQSGIPYDYALIRFDNNVFSGYTPLGLVVSITNPANYNYISRGYPAASPFNGNFINECNTLGCRRDSNMSPQCVGIACNSNGGSSGGPWFNGENMQITSVNSYTYNNQAGVMYGPYFDANTRNFFNSVVQIAKNNATTIN